MKLYYSIGACSLSPHIVLREAGVDFKLVRTDLKKKTTESGEDFWKINPKGQVPVLQLDNGEVLTEGPAIVQYIASLAPEKNLVPTDPGLTRFRMLEWLNFIGTELHKTWSPLWNPALPEADKDKVRETIRGKFKYLETPLTQNKYLLGDTFTVADAYLFTVASWGRFTNVEVPNFLASYLERVAQRPAVQEALKAEGLNK